MAATRLSRQVGTTSQSPQVRIPFGQEQDGSVHLVACISAYAAWQDRLNHNIEPHDSAHAILSDIQRIMQPAEFSSRPIIMAGDINFVSKHGRGAKREMRTRDRARSDQVFGRAESMGLVCSGPMSGTARAWQPDPEGIMTTPDPTDKRPASPTQLHCIRPTSEIAQHPKATALNSKDD